MMMIRCVLMLWGMGTVPFKTGKVKCSVLYEPDWLGDNRTLFADGAFFQVAIGEPIRTHCEKVDRTVNEIQMYLPR